MDNKGITLGELKGILPFATLLVALVMAWASLNSSLALIHQKTETLNDKLNDSSVKIAALEAKQSEMTVQLTRLTTIIEGAQKNGQITFSSKDRKQLALAPTPTPTPVQVFLNLESNDNTKDDSANITPEPTNTPTPTPRPSPNPFVPTIKIPLFNMSILGVR